MKFFNSSRGPLAVTLSDGHSFMMPPKCWSDIPDDVCNSESIADYVSKGFLVKSLINENVVQAEKTNVVSSVKKIVKGS